MSDKNPADLRLIFEGMYGDSLGHIDYVDGKLITDSPMLEHLVTHWVESGRTIEDFVAYHNEYSNGHLNSKGIPIPDKEDNDAKE